VEFAVGLAAVTFAELPLGLVQEKRWPLVTIGTRSMPTRARPLARFLLQRVEIDLPSGACAITAFGSPSGGSGW